MSCVQRIAVIPGDGIGKEVTAAARTVLDAVAGRHALEELGGSIELSSDD